MHRECANQRVAPAVREVSIRPAEPAQVAEVVGQAEIGFLDPRPADGASSLRIGLEHHLLFGGEQRSVAEIAAGEPPTYIAP